MTSSSKKGFLLTRQVQDLRHSLQLTYWLKGDSGPVKLSVEHEKTIFFVENQSVEQAREILNQANIKYQSKPLSLKTFNDVAVHGFYFAKLSVFYKARDVLKKQGIKCYEDDIRPEDRFLMERFITGGVEYVGVEQQSYKYQSFNQAMCKSSDYQPELSMLSIDLECSMAGDLYSMGCYSDTIEKVFMIGAPEDDANPYIEWVVDECDLLLKFITWLNDYDPDIIIGWNVINFDFKLLQKRCDLNNIKFAIGRDGSIPMWRQNRLSPEQNFILIAGRVVLDGIDLLKSATFSFPSFSLENVSRELLGIGKDIDSVDNRVAEITRKFHQQKQSLAAYNLEDCRLVWLIFKKNAIIRIYCFTINPHRLRARPSRR